jgi:hypothetical protein
MPYTTITLGLTLTVPTLGTLNWGSTFANTTLTKISGHDHTGSGNGSQIGTTAIVDAAITKAKLAADIGYTQQTLLAPVGTTQTIDWDNGSIAPLDLGSASGDVTLTLSNPQEGLTYIIKVIQGATPRDIVFPATVKFPQGQVPLLSQTNDAIDKIVMYYDGTNYLADWNITYA